MKVSITRATAKAGPLRQGEVFAWEDGLYVVTSRQDDIIDAVVIHANSRMGTQAGIATFFYESASDVRRVTSLVAATE